MVVGFTNNRIEGSCINPYIFTALINCIYKQMNCLTKTKKHNTILFTPPAEQGQAGGVSGLVVQTIHTIHKVVKC